MGIITDYVCPTPCNPSINLYFAHLLCQYNQNTEWTEEFNYATPESVWVLSEVIFIVKCGLLPT